jgi:hypothetical protein
VCPHLDLDQNKPATAKEKSLQQDQLIVGTYSYNCCNIQKNALEQKHIKIRLLCGATSRMSQCNINNHLLQHHKE